MVTASFAVMGIYAADAAQPASPNTRAARKAAWTRTNAPTGDACLPYASRQHPAARRIVPGRDKSTQSRTIVAIEVYEPPACEASYTRLLRSAQKCSQCTSMCSNRSGLPMNLNQYCGVLQGKCLALFAAPVFVLTGPRECESGAGIFR